MEPGNKYVVQSFERTLRLRNRSPRTIQSYREALDLLMSFVGPGRLLEELTADEVGDFVLDQLTRHKATTAGTRFRSLRAFYNWAVAEEIVVTSPMARMQEPAAQETVPDVLTIAELTAMVKTITAPLQGAGGERVKFEQLRDHAILRLFMDSGARLSEITALSLDDVDMVADEIRVMGKGRRERLVGFGAKAGRALDKYLRARARHSHAGLPNLWIGGKGAMTPSGVTQMLRRRATQAGVIHLHAHRFRHTFAHMWKLDGGSSEDLKRTGGWRSDAMVARYGSSAASERARIAQRRLGIGDRI